ncbi:hypothetical protein [Paenibacillus sp. JJ-100]|uniref:hypothetical protein n=2 Tax=unclassified Paenibacillus TaxID=185978 RepID=UPI00233116DF|nr:hypothetical protein [Paenibacillus sp. JJ-100]
MKSMRKYAFLFCLIILSAFILGGCQRMNANEDEALLQEAENIAIQHMKEKYDLDVVITSEKKLPRKAVAEISLKGHVVDQEEQRFNLYVNYERKEVTSMGMSEDFKQLLIDKGYDPFKK